MDLLVEAEAERDRDRAHAGLPSRSGGALIGVLAFVSSVSLVSLALFGPRPPNVARYLGTTQAALPQSMAVAATTVAPSTLAPDTTAELLPADLDFPVAVPASSTALELPAAATGHRVYVDGTLVGEPPSPMMVGCGRRVVQIGSIGRARVVALPCGERAALAYP